MDILPTILANEKLPVPVTPHDHGTTVAGRARRRARAAGRSRRSATVASWPSVSAPQHDKYVWRFSPENDELYFDLDKDPGEKQSRLAEAGGRVRVLKPAVEAAMVTDSFRRKVRVRAPGPGTSASSTPRLDGWRRGVRPLARGGVRAPGRRAPAAPRLSSRAGTPARRSRFGIRPIAAPVWVAGTRDAGERFCRADVFLAEEALPPGGDPGAVRRRGGRARAEAEHLRAAARSAARLRVWLVLPPGSPDGARQGAQERLRALGYLGPDSGGPRNTPSGAGVASARCRLKAGSAGGASSRTPPGAGPR